MSKTKEQQQEKDMQVTTGLFGAAVGAFMGLHIQQSPYNTAVTVGAFGAMAVADELDLSRKHTVKAFCIGYIPAWAIISACVLLNEASKNNQVKF